MKQFAFIVLFAFAPLLTCSCERNTLDVQPTVDEHVLYDFKTRFPAAQIIDISNQLDGKTDIHFTDKDGYNGTAIYLNGIWMISEKAFNSDDFLYAIPREVAKTYIGTGIKNEDYNSDNFYVIEVSRNGIDKKQYEFSCIAPFDDGSKKIDNLRYNIVIDENGTLLACSHNNFNRSIWWYDMRTSINCVRNKYGNVPILGAVNDFGDNVMFIRDNGLVKTVVLHDRGFGFQWKETRYPLNKNTVLPESALADKEQYESTHPGQEFYALSFLDCPDGSFYGLTFGTELNNSTIYSIVE